MWLNSSGLPRQSSSLLQMPREVYAPMKDPNHCDPAIRPATEYNMRSHGILVISRANMVARAAQSWTSLYKFDRRFGLANIKLGLFDAPARGRVIPNLVDVSLCAR
jgi:hypothetical protein